MPCHRSPPNMFVHSSAGCDLPLGMGCARILYRSDEMRAALSIALWRIAGRKRRVTVFRERSGKRVKPP